MSSGKDLYRIVYRGDLAFGMSEDEVRGKLKQRFRFSDAALIKLFSGRNVIIKSDLDEATAQRYAKAMWEAGARCAVEPMEDKAPALELAGRPPTKAAATMSCPKCGQEQPEAEICIGCGVVIAKYLERQQAESAPDPVWGAAEPTVNGPATSTATAGVREALAGTRPWVRLVSILMFIGAGLGALATLLSLAVGGGQGAPVGLVVVLQVVMCALYIIPAVFLFKYAGAIGAFLQGEGAADLEAALGYQKSFWKFIGILTLIMMVLAVVGIVAAVLIPMMAMR